MKSVKEWLDVFEQEVDDYSQKSHGLRRYDKVEEDKPRGTRRVHYPEYDNVHEDYLPQPKKRAKNRNDRSKQI